MNLSLAYPRIVPMVFRGEVIRMHIEGKSAEEIAEMIGLSEDLVHNILSDFDFPQNQNLLLYQLAVRFGKNGQDIERSSDLIEAKKVLVHQGLLPKDALRLITDLTEFFHATGLGPDVLVSSFGIYSKFSSKMSIRTYDDLKKKTLKIYECLEGFRREVKVLQEQYKKLGGRSDPHNN